MPRMASLKTYDKLLNDEVEKERMVISLRDMLITPNVLKNGFSSVDMERLDRTLKQVAPVFKIAAPPASDVYTDAICRRPASESCGHRTLLPDSGGFDVTSYLHNSPCKGEV